MAGPLFLLFGKAAVFVLRDHSPFPAISASLFLQSVLVNAASTLLCGGLGLLAALGVWTMFEHLYQRVFIAMLLCALIPPFIHVHSWIKVMDSLNAFIETISGLSFNFSGVVAVVWTTAFSYLPFTVSFCLMGIFSIPREESDLLRMEIRPGTLFRKCVVPHFLPYLLISSLFVFLITMNDYAIPSVFGVNVFALELFSLFSASGKLYSIALSSLPLILLSVLLLGVFGAGLKRVGLTSDPVMNCNPFKEEGFMKKMAAAGVAVLLLFALVPIGSMVIESFFTKDFVRILLGSGKEIGYSLLVSFGVAVLTVIPSALLASFWYRSKANTLLLLLLASPFLIPSAILGLGLIAFWNRGGLAGIYQSPFMPVIGLAVRFGILSILFLTVRMSRIEQALMDAMHLSYSFFKGFFHVLLPMLWRDLVTCALLVFALSMGEYGIVLLVTPPGYQMLTIKIYNYLHYGASEVVFTLNLFVFLLVLLAGAVVFQLNKPIKKERKSQNLRRQ
jgi:iron(III) transport system permease protein